MTITEAIRGYILGDATLAAKVPEVYPGPPPEDVSLVGHAIVRIVSNPSFGDLDGASELSNMRIEVSFFCQLNGDAERSANRFRSLIATFHGTMGTLGVKLSVFQTMGPRTIHDQKTGYYGFQVDVLATVDQSTIS